MSLDLVAIFLFELFYSVFNYAAALVWSLAFVTAFLVFIVRVFKKSSTEGR